MTATEVLRRMLDERGVEWWQKKRHTCWKVSKGQEVEMWRAWEAPDGSLTLKVDYIYGLTPEQAIAATLGAGTCHDLAETPDYRDKTEFKCSECGYEYSAVGGFGCDYGDEPDFRFCPECGRKVVNA